MAKAVHVDFGAVLREYDHCLRVSVASSLCKRSETVIVVCVNFGAVLNVPKHRRRVATRGRTGEGSSVALVSAVHIKYFV